MADATLVTERAQLLLKTLIERYIVEGQPVGSRALSKFSGLDLSPASIRNIMADLEEMGFIASPHTSAGRVPTPRGYRFFVDTLLTVKPLDRVEIHQLEEQLDTENRRRLVASASHLLSELTHFAGVVMTPRRSAGFRHIEFLRLSESRILVIIVTPEGDVQNRILQVERSFTSSELTEAANILNQNYAGLTFEEIKRRIRDELRQLTEDMTRLMTAALEAGSRAASESSDDVVISGEFGAVEGDEVLLRQAFSNLLRNAVEACVGASVAAVVAIRSDVDATQKLAHITVTDNGPGIPAQSRERIFQPFFTSKRSGTGLGLALVQKIIVFHNGRVVAGTSPAGGASMQVTLPLA